MPLGFPSEEWECLRAPKQDPRSLADGEEFARCLESLLYGDAKNSQTKDDILILSGMIGRPDSLPGWARPLVPFVGLSLDRHESLETVKVLQDALERYHVFATRRL